MPATYGLPDIKKGKRLMSNSKERQDFAALVIKAYRKGASIRDLMVESGRSYGAIHRILAETPGVRMRRRGGANHHPAGRKAPRG